MYPVSAQGKSIASVNDLVELSVMVTDRNQSITSCLTPSYKVQLSLYCFQLCLSQRISNLSHSVLYILATSNIFESRVKMQYTIEYNRVRNRFAVATHVNYSM